MSKSIRRLLIASALAVFMLGGSSAVAGTIDFASLAGNNLDAFSSYTDVILGFTVTATGGGWYVGKIYGDPVPDIFAGPYPDTQIPAATPLAPAGGLYDPAAPDTITIAMTGGGTFVFESLRISANNGPSDYIITGTDGGNPVFTQSGTENNSDPWAFATLTSIDSTNVITLLTISLAGSAGSTTSYNIDNIVVSATERPNPPDQIPEPTTLALSGLALAALGLTRKLRA